MWVVRAFFKGAEEQASDADVMAAVERGDPDALALLYDRHARLVYSLALRIVRDGADAEEVVQDVFAQVWRQRARYDRRRGSVAGWLAMIARSRAIDRLRHRESRPPTGADSPGPSGAVDPAVCADTQLVSAAQAADVRRALSELPMTQRIAIELAFFEGMTYADVAEHLETPVGTVKTRIRQGLLALRQRLTAEDA